MSSVFGEKNKKTVKKNGVFHSHTLDSSLPVFANTSPSVSKEVDMKQLFKSDQKMKMSCCKQTEIRYATAAARSELPMGPVAPPLRTVERARSDRCLKLQKGKLFERYRDPSVLSQSIKSHEPALSRAFSSLPPVNQAKTSTGGNRDTMIDNLPFQNQPPMGHCGHCLLDGGRGSAIFARESKHSGFSLINTQHCMAGNLQAEQVVKTSDLQGLHPAVFKSATKIQRGVRNKACIPRTRNSPPVGT